MKVVSCKKCISEGYCSKYGCGVEWIKELKKTPNGVRNEERRILLDIFLCTLLEGLLIAAFFCLLYILGDIALNIFLK